MDTQEQLALKNGELTADQVFATEQERQSQRNPSAFRSIFEAAKQNAAHRKALRGIDAEYKGRALSDDEATERARRLDEENSRYNDEVASRPEPSGMSEDAKSALSDMGGALKDALVQGTGNALGAAFNANYGQNTPAPGDASLQRIGDLRDQKGAALNVTAQQQQQIANRNEYAEADKKDLARAGNEATKAVNQLGAAAGSGAAALAGAKAAASTGGSDVNAEQQRQDMNRAMASQTRGQAMDSKIAGESARFNAANRNEMWSQGLQRNQAANDLSTGYGGMSSLIGRFGEKLGNFAQKGIDAIKNSRNPEEGSANAIEDTPESIANASPGDVVTRNGEPHELTAEEIEAAKQQAMASEGEQNGVE